MADGDTEKENSNVLVVDDDKAVRTLVSAALSRRGYDVTMAENGRIGVEHVRAAPQRYKLILIDYRMPEMDGLAACRDIREFAPDMPVILMSTEELEIDLVNAGVREFLLKPFAAMDLIDLVDRHL